MKQTYCNIILFGIILSSYTNINAQSPDWLWAKSFGGNNSSGSSYIKIDANGSIYTIGSFSGVADLDPEPGPAIHNLTSAGLDDIYISKLNSAGNFIWAKQIGFHDEDRGEDIAIDAAGYLYITGYFQGTVDFDPDLGVYLLTSSHPLGTDIFIAKYDRSGNFKWAAAMGDWYDDYGYSIAVDAASNVYTTGKFDGTVDFDPDSAGTFLMTTNNSDNFISKLDSLGKFKWAKSFGGYDNFSIAVDDSGNCYTTGDFQDTSDFDPGPGIYNLISNGGTDIFISKLDSSGNLKWAYSFGSSINDYGSSITLDGSGNVYTSGNFSDTVDFNPGSGISNLISNSGLDVFILKLDLAGNFIRAKSFGGSSYIGGTVKNDKLGNIYIIGSFNDTADFDPGSGIYNLVSNGIYDFYISKLDSSGNFLWAISAGGSDVDGIASIAFDASGYIYASGSFSSSNITFGLTTLISNSAPGYRDMFIAKLDNTINGIDKVNDNRSVSLYPNPASDYLRIVLSENHKNADMIVTDMSGKILYTSIIKDSQKIDLNISDLSDGIYLLQIKADDFIEMRKFVVAR